MTAAVISGRELAAKLRAEVTSEVEALMAGGVHPGLAIVTATDDESSAWYVRSLQQKAQQCGIRSSVVDVGADADREAIVSAVSRLNADPEVHGIIVQTPLPSGISVDDVAEVIDPAKDVDGANPVSIGRLAAGKSAFPPATAEAVVALLDHHGVALAGQDVTIVGRSLVVGKPAALLLLARDATVTVCHSRTRDLNGRTRSADVVVVATGRPSTLTAEGVRAGAVVIDVGTNPDGAGGLIGDADPGVAEVAGALTPVPGGVGPVTAMLLMRHTVQAAR